MQQSFVITLVVLVSLSGLMLAKGMTGHVVSETCCSGPQCTQESLCDEYQVPGQAHKSSSWLLAGMLLFIVSFALFIATLFTHRRR